MIDYKKLLYNSERAKWFLEQDKDSMVVPFWIGPETRSPLDNYPPMTIYPDRLVECEDNPLLLTQATETLFRIKKEEDLPSQILKLIWKYDGIMSIAVNQNGGNNACVNKSNVDEFTQISSDDAICQDVILFMANNVFEFAEDENYIALKPFGINVSENETNVLVPISFIDSWVGVGDRQELGL